MSFVIFPNCGCRLGRLRPGFVRRTISIGIGIQIAVSSVGAADQNTPNNAVHTLVGPLLMVTYAYLTKSLWLLPYALIWIAHIGLDRMLGFGLKYPTRFGDTHLRKMTVEK